jgi:hypothetical protein
MSMFMRVGRAAILALLALCAAPSSRCLAQFGNAGGFTDAFTSLGQSGMQMARVPPQGGWAEVLTVTPKWLVIQTQSGQQFPVAFAGTQLFVIRWPTTLDKVAPGALVEATGVDAGTNQVITDHIDVYEGTANQLGVAPTIQTIIGMNRILSMYDNDQHNVYGQDMYRFLTPDEINMPRKLHVVGPILDLNPLRLAIPGANAISIVGTMGSFYVTSVTPGSSSFVQKGDLVFFVPQELTIKSLNLSQLVVYKKIPRSQ